MKLLKRLLLIVVVIELAYLVLVNLALNLPLTQDLINDIRPEKFAVHWQRAWSWYPFRVHVRGVTVDGQTSSQQWSAQGSAADASIHLWKLVNRTVHVYDIDARDASFQLRPRPKPDNDYADVREFFPTIAGRDPNAVAVVKDPDAPKKQRKLWNIELDDIEASGSHEVWIRQVRVQFDGSASADVSVTTGEVEVLVDNGRVEVDGRSLLINGVEAFGESARVVGSAGFGPFRSSEHRGIDALTVLQLDVDVDAQVERLDFLDLYLRRYSGLDVDGTGVVDGHLNYVDGSLRPGTALDVAANELSVAALGHAALGQGGIELRVTEQQPDAVQVGIRFGELRGLHLDNGDELFAGQGLTGAVVGPAGLLPVDRSQPAATEVSLELPSVVVADVAAWQRYLPDRWGLALYRGRGELTAHAVLTATEFDAGLTLTSPGTEVGIRDFRFETGLDLGLKLHSESLDQAVIDISGSHLRLDQTQLAQQQRGESDEWQSSLAVERGVLSLPLSTTTVADGAADDPGQGFRALLHQLQAQGVKQALGDLDGDFRVAGRVSDFGWIGLLFRNPYHIDLTGSGQLSAELKLDHGSLASGTRIDAQAARLGAEFLDYRGVGDGSAALNVTRGGRHPDMDLSVELREGEFKRRHEQQAFVEDVVLALTAQGRQLGISDLKAGTTDDVSLQLKIPSARVTDMGVYNQYLPPDFPFQIVGGQADLKADIELEPESAGGFVKLTSKGLKTRLDQQHIDGELTADIRLAGGTPRDMAFDISGSTLRLDRVRVSGDTETFDADDWRAELKLHHANTVWRKPMQLDMQAGITISDSRPVVAVFSNQRGKHGWLSKLLTVKDIQGEVELKLDVKKLTVGRAFAGSDKIDVGAKGIVAPDNRSGVFYARWRKLKAIIEVRDGDRDFGLIKARQKFDAYRPGQAAPIVTGSRSSLEQLEALQE